jgi:hypothetical protein
MTWTWNRKRHKRVMAIKEASSFSSLSSAEMFAEDKAHKKQSPPLAAPALKHSHSAQNESTFASATQDSQSSKHSVRFSDVEIRPYRITLGDNAWTDIPLGLDWDYDEPQCVSIDAFEDNQHFKAGTYKSANDFEPLTTLERLERLRRAGYTGRQVRQLERKRKIELVMSWAYRHNREELTPSPCFNGHVYFHRYVI